MKQSKKQGAKNQVGAHGEAIAVRYLQKRGLKIVEQNYLRPWGEIDVVARGTDQLHFVEVKTVSYETRAHLEQAINSGTWRPEENVHPKKLRRLYRAIETWVAEHQAPETWQIDVVAVRVVVPERYATVKYLPNIIE